MIRLDGPVTISGMGGAALGGEGATMDVGRIIRRSRFENIDPSLYAAATLSPAVWDRPDAHALEVRRGGIA